MKLNIFVFGVALLTCTNCTRPTDDLTSKKVAALEAKVETLEKRNSDLALKGEIVSGLLFRSGLDRFFVTAEFWENVYDSGQADCARRCISAATAERAACEKNPNDVERQQCFQRASDNASRCQTQCSQSHPPPQP
jgi:hypothetical protein